MRLAVLFFVVLSTISVMGGDWIENVSISEVSCDNEELGAAFKSVFAATAPATGYILLLPGGKKGSVSMKAKNISLAPVLQALCRQGGLEYCPSGGNVVLIGPKIGKEAMVSKDLKGFGDVKLDEFQIENATLEAFFKKLSGVLKKRGGRKVELKYLPDSPGKGKRSKRGGRSKKREESGDDGDDDTFFGIDWKGKGAGKLSISLKDIALPELLFGVARLTGFKISVAGDSITVDSGGMKGMRK